LHHLRGSIVSRRRASGGGCVRGGRGLAASEGSGNTAIGTIEVDRDGGVQVLALHGEHDISTASDLREALDRAHESGGSVVVDMSDVDFVDSTVLQGLLSGRDRAGGAGSRFAIVVPETGVARRLLSLTSLQELIPTYTSRTDAVAAVGRSAGA
jgi:anti-anti-sigma factor